MIFNKEDLEKQEVGTVFVDADGDICELRMYDGEFFYAAPFEEELFPLTDTAYPVELLATGADISHKVSALRAAAHFDGGGIVSQINALGGELLGKALEGSQLFAESREELKLEVADANAKADKALKAVEVLSETVTLLSMGIAEFADGLIPKKPSPEDLKVGMQVRAKSIYSDDEYVGYLEHGAEGGYQLGERSGCRGILLVEENDLEVLEVLNDK